MTHQERKNSPLDWSGRQVAVTGATGMLGTELVRQLLPTGARLRLIVRDMARLDRLYEALGERPEAEVVECALVNPVELREAFEGVDVVFHCAAQVNLHPGADEELVRRNTEMTHQVVNACLGAGVGRLVHVSSIATLGDPNERGLIDEHSYPDTLAGWSGYSLSKFYAENEVWRGMQYGLQAVIVNPAVIWGPGDWNGNGSAALFAFLAKGWPFYPPGTVGCVDGRDVARAMILLSVSEAAVGRRFVLSAENCSYGELMNCIAKNVCKCPPRFRAGEKTLRRLQRLWAWGAALTGKPSRLTEGVVKTAVTTSRYDGNAVRQVIGFEYTPMEETLSHLAERYLKEKKK